MKKLILLLFIPLVSFSQDYYGSVEYLDIDSCLDVHNKARAEVGAKQLFWSPELANDAQKYAEELANKDSMVHSEENNGQGENLYYSYKSKTLNGVKSFEFSETPFTDASNAWYGEIVDYSYGPIKNDSHFYKIGHYTQMIWSTTKELGMGYAKSKSGKIYVVARYYPQGNYIGEYPY